MEEERLKVLLQYDVLDTSAEPEFERVTALAAKVFVAPIALISLVDRNRQWFKSRVGLALQETPRSMSFCAHAIEGDEPLVIEDARLDPRFADNPLVTGEPHMRFYAGAPLIAPSGARLGTVCVIDREPRRFGATDVELLRGLAAIVIDTLELRQRSRELAADRTRHELILASIADGVALLDAERRLVLANDAYRAMFALSATPGLTRADFAAHLDGLLENPAVDMPRFFRVSLAPSTDECFELRRPRRRVLRRTVRPVVLDDGPGYLVVWHDETAQHDLLAERERSSLTDPLTGLANRRGAELAAEREVARARRAGTPLSLCMVDVDHFKQVNDALGHVAGDEVLRRVADTLRDAGRITDVVSRWGGEEFLALLPGPLAGAAAFAERARAALRSAPFYGRAVTLSAGVAELLDGEAFEDAVARADAALYQAKRSGRDRVCGADAAQR